MKRLRVSDATFQWFTTHRDMSDHERGEAAADKTRLIISMFLYISEHAKDWLTIQEISTALGMHIRQTRRYMHRLGASGFCELRIPANKWDGLEIRIKEAQ